MTILKESFHQERWNLLSNELKYAVAVYCLDFPYFSNVVKETGMSATDAHSAQNHLVDMGKIDGYGEWTKLEKSWVRVPKTCPSEVAFLEGLVGLLREVPQ